MKFLHRLTTGRSAPTSRQAMKPTVSPAEVGGGRSSCSAPAAYSVPSRAACRVKACVRLLPAATASARFAATVACPRAASAVPQPIAPSARLSRPPARQRHPHFERFVPLVLSAFLPSPTGMKDFPSNSTGQTRSVSSLLRRLFRRPRSPFPPVTTTSTPTNRHGFKRYSPGGSCRTGPPRGLRRLEGGRASRRPVPAGISPFSTMIMYSICRR